MCNLDRRAGVAFVSTRHILITPYEEPLAQNIWTLSVGALEACSSFCIADSASLSLMVNIQPQPPKPLISFPPSLLLSQPYPIYKFTTILHQSCLSSEVKMAKTKHPFLQLLLFILLGATVVVQGHFQFSAKTSSCNSIVAHWILLCILLCCIDVLNLWSFLSVVGSACSLSVLFIIMWCLNRFSLYRKRETSVLK